MFATSGEITLPSHEPHKAGYMGHDIREVGHEVPTETFTGYLLLYEVQEQQ